MEIKQKKCKTALSKSNLPGLDYSLNPYTGCAHKCAYCYVPNVMHLDRENWGEKVTVKENIPVVLAKELRNKKPGRVGISTVTDTYQPIEQKYRLTRYCLEQLLIHDYPVCIQTKSNLVKRDKDLISKFSKAELMISIGTINDKERQLLEPFSSSINERFELLKYFSETPIVKSVFFGPIYPSFKLEDINIFFDKLQKNNVSKIMIDKFNLKPGIYSNLEKTLQNNKKTFEVFKENLKKQKFYQQIRKQIIKESKKRNIEFIDAF